MDETISNKVKKLRKKVGVTQEKLAEEVGVTRQTIIAIEKGNYAPSLSLAFKIADFFNTKVEKVFKIKSK